MFLQLNHSYGRSITYHETDRINLNQPIDIASCISNKMCTSSDNGKDKNVIIFWELNVTHKDIIKWKPRTSWLTLDFCHLVHSNSDVRHCNIPINNNNDNNKLITATFVIHFMGCPIFRNQFIYMYHIYISFFIHQTHQIVKAFVCTEVVTG